MSPIETGGPIGQPSLVQQHPTGTVAVVIGCGLMLLRKFTSVDFSVDESLTILTAVTALASALSPRFRRN